jgi:thymidine kinase
MDINTTDPRGRIEIITGCMFASKTEELIHRARRAEIAGKNVQGFKPEIDDRYTEDTICSHNGVEIDAIPIKNDIEGMNTILDNVTNETDVIIIDEANFFTKDLVDTVKQLADNKYRVIISGLDQTFRGEPFEPLPSLLAIADNVEKRNAVCECCGKPATKTQRLIDGEPAAYDSPTIAVGGNEKYEPRCRYCHVVS